ncbi:poly-gamma-glutamate biosynthesis protein [Methanobrevibacter olleyae]|uniref:Poly-gamma-glutamate biosynthesis protein n=2 Tax=Methanobrevibacter olleyae TaxID=294671 RepID=A0A126QZN4_METOL|nr:poly-gamma-glutamate biosynthesis protein [Methanobrevibacter olleyae]
MMRKKRFFQILIGITLILLAISIYGTILVSLDDSSDYDLGHDNVSIAVTGDIMFGRKMPAVLDSGKSPFRYVENVTKTADILLVNFENPVTTSSYAVKGDVPLKANPKYTYLLANANSIVVASQANNHALDYGQIGLNESIKNLKDADIYVIGAGNNVSEATKPVTIESGDRRVTILNYMDADNFREYKGVMDPAGTNSSGYSAYNYELAQKQVQEARDNGSSIVIAYLHYGNEYSRSPNENQIKISHELIDDGADIVIGSHTHVTQGVEIYNGKPIFYNLGNFIFDQSNPATHRSYFLNLDLVEDNCTVTLYPTYISNYLPHFMDARSGKALINELNPQCDELTVNEKGQGVLTFSLANVTNETS